MKRPAAAAGLKRPAAKAEEEDTPEGAHQPLTAQAVKDHNKFCEEAAQMSSSQFEKALSCLDEKAAMRLWKAFEKSRKSSGAQEEYKATTSESVGSLAKKRKLLFGWVCDGQTTGEHYKAMVDKVSLKKSEGVTSTWLTKAQALAHWGKEELQERVASGSIVARKDPADPNYWQFRANTEQSQVNVTREQAFTFEKKNKSNLKELEQVMRSKGLEKLTEADFCAPSEESGEDSDGLPAGLSKALGTKSDKSKKEKKEKKEGKKDKWEETSTVQEEDGQAQLLNRLMAFKVELTKDLATLDGLCHSKDMPKALLKDVAKTQKEGQEVLTLVGKLHKDKGKKKEVAPALQKAFAVLKKLKAKKLLVSKALKA